ncbi:MAG: VWA domain-containing protein [Saprospiraceae bacterium]
MFRFENPQHLLLLAIVLLLCLLYLGYSFWQKRNMNVLGKKDLLNRLMPNYSITRQRWKVALSLLSLLFLIGAMANPQWGTKKEKVKAQSSDVFIALDISRSMMAEDISPNRLERAKRLTQNLIKSLRGNRLGIILFAGNAYLQMPLSNDASAAEMFISSANTNQATTQGTAISEAIDLAMKAYDEGEAFQRALIIITDGENHDDEAIAKVKEASEKGLNIFTIGVGTEAGSFIPVKSASGNQYKRDDQGELVKSALNPQLIRDLAKAGGGKHYFIQDGNEILIDLKRQIDRLEKQEVEQRSFSDYESYFQYLLGLGLLFFIIEFFISPKRKMSLEG